MLTGKYIRVLLEERKRVILAGFGNLEVIVPDGSKKPSENWLDPPGLAVRFDASYSKDDGVLAETVAAGESIEREEARQRVLELVDAIKFSLDKGEDFLLPGLGVFLKDTDGKVHFRTDPAWVLDPDQYGLESMDVFELEELPEEDPGSESSETESKSSAEPTKLAPPKPKPRSRKWRLIWVVAAVLITVLVVLLLIPSGEEEQGQERGLFNKKADQEVAGQSDASGEQADETPAEEPDETPAEEPGEQAGEAETISAEAGQEGETTVPGEEAKKYFIIAGSFNKLNNASDLQDKLRSRGYGAEVMITENRMYRVSVASYATKEEAENALDQFKSEPDLQSCWLLSN